MIKLADFGVATKINETRKSDSVVGTPYWSKHLSRSMRGGPDAFCCCSGT